ncbi:alpha/beta hydrolase [Mangrovimonas sp. CR14]|uniref:alpha/beta hydrolase family protein n=1 Tax=Mangrovimonas sp. CR14 TaxID=2706120 RepID=UPI001420558D|nr:alpha/beta hydrolase [Mangrovimonas sp. CR14]NIK93331.1 alpha/beta hydrolase [Mangrovimonas sp. CR14]
MNLNKKTISLFLLLISTSLCLFAQTNRPQEPKEPFDYVSENVVFENKVDHISLAGTLTYPKKGSNFPAVILISGSGPQDRNSELLKHKPFLVISDYLTNNGLAVLRVDDRETGESQGSYNYTGLDGFVNDTESAFQYLKSRKELNHSQIGLIGHSLGGVIAPIVASENKGVAFIVLLAGSGIRGDQLMLLQKELIERKAGVPEFGIAQGQNNMKGAYDLIIKLEDRVQLQGELKDYFTKIFGAMLPENQINTLSEQMSWPWLTDFIKFDPQTVLSKTTCPVLALNGSNDLQVPPKENLAAIEKILHENGNKDVTVLELEKLNHLFQESETGLPNEYGTIEQTFSPQAMAIVLDWIKERTE